MATSAAGEPLIKISQAYGVEYNCHEKRASFVPFLGPVKANGL